MMLELQRAQSERVRSYVMVNPNHKQQSLDEISRAVEQGAVGLKLAASRRANDPLLDDVIALARTHGLPVLHHIWQHCTRDWPGQDASNASDLCELAVRHPGVYFILAHIGGGGDYEHTFDAVRDVENVFLDLSGSGVDRGMLDGAVDSVGAQRLLWGSDLTMETGLAKLRALPYAGLSESELSLIRWRNALRIFPGNAFPMISAEHAA
jgi:predicted TIM-barrel fold metal-dependent hydrolase